MICTYPGCVRPTQVISTRTTDINELTRRRQCTKGHRFTTVETVKPPRNKVATRQ
jgi:transcriptional regulator NrdR family protein